MVCGTGSNVIALRHAHISLLVAPWTIHLQTRRHDVEHVATQVKGNGGGLQRLPCLARSFLVPTFQHLTNRSGASPLSDMRLLLREASDPLIAHFEETTLQASEVEKKQNKKTTAVILNLTLSRCFHLVGQLRLPARCSAYAATATLE